MVHLTECLHGSDNLRTGHLLVEGVNKAVGTRAIVERNRKGVKLRIESVCLSAKGQPSGHAELEDRGEKTRDVLVQSDNVQYRPQKVYKWRVKPKYTTANISILQTLQPDKTEVCHHQKWQLF